MGWMGYEDVQTLAKNRRKNRRVEKIDTGNHTSQEIAQSFPLKNDRIQSQAAPWRTGHPESGSKHCCAWMREVP